MKEERKELEKKEKSGISEKFGKPIGIYELEVIDKETGKILETRKVKNLVVNRAKSTIRHMLFSSDGWNVTVGKVKIGKNGTAPTVNDTDLVEPYRTENSNTYWDETNQRRVVEALFINFTETVNICEAGVFDLSNNMFSRVTFPSIEMTPTKNLRVKIYIIP